MFEKLETGIPGCVVLKPRKFRDNRGSLVKIFHADAFGEHGLRTDFREEYFSESRKGVLRGLHFQVPPHEHVKCVTCIKGAIYDVVVDLRRGSPAFSHHFSIRLDDEDASILYIPPGLAHGFYTLSDSAIFLNRTTSVFSPESDTGIRWDSCGIEWPDATPILSDKDRNMVTLEEFVSPFVLEVF